MKQRQKHHIMKTLIETLTVSLTIYASLFLLVAGISFGAELNTNPPSKATYAVPAFEEEAYIDDIPFDTKAVADAHYGNTQPHANIDFEEEAYIDDIPFNTATVAAEYLYDKALNTAIDYEDEAYVDDIPFSTSMVVAACSDNLVLGR
jgi:hypothetical protein